MGRKLLSRRWLRASAGVAAVTAFGCNGKGPDIGMTDQRTSVTWCNYYVNECKEWGIIEYEAEAEENMMSSSSNQVGENQTETSATSMRGGRIKRQYKYCKTPGATPLCDEKIGCEVCFDPAAAARNGLNRSDVCLAGCREFNAGGSLGRGGDIAGSGCRFFSIPNTSDVHQAAPIQHNRCEAGLLTKSTQSLVIEDGHATTGDAQTWRPVLNGSPVLDFATVTVRARNAFGDEDRTLRVTDGQVTIVPEYCWSEADGTQCLFAINELYLRVSGFEARGHTLTNIEIKNDRAVELFGPSNGSGPATPKTSARLIARLNYDGEPRRWALRSDSGFTGEIHYDDPHYEFSNLSGTFSTRMADAGPLGTDVTMTFTINAWFRADDVDGDGVRGHLDNCRTTFNPDQKDSDRDRIGNVCDKCDNIVIGPPDPRRPNPACN